VASEAIKIALLKLELAIFRKSIDHIDSSILQAYALAYTRSAGDTRMPGSERHVRLFRNGRNQAVRIPREFELEGDEAIMRKEGGRLIVEPIRKGRLLSLLATLSPLDEPFPDVDENLPPLDEAEL
jgi:antitoxin VapB